VVQNYEEKMNTHMGRLGAYATACAALLFFSVIYVSNDLGGGTNIVRIGVPSLIQQVFDFDRDDFWTFFAALFAIMNPLVALPLFVRVTRGSESAVRRRVALICSVAVLLTLIAAALFGQQLLGFFAISIGSFRIAGGVIVLLMGLAMMRSESDSTEGRDSGEEATRGDAHSHAICPMAIPLLAGPGAIAIIILQSQTAVTPADFGLITCVIASIFALTYLTLRLAGPIARFLGSTGLMVTTRLIGMIVAAIALDMMVIGLRLSFPGAL
jgi:multiple antibiotic resistance protein